MGIKKQASGQRRACYSEGGPGVSGQAVKPIQKHKRSRERAIALNMVRRPESPPGPRISRPSPCQAMPPVTVPARLIVKKRELTLRHDRLLPLQNGIGGSAYVTTGPLSAASRRGVKGSPDWPQ